MTVQFRGTAIFSPDRRYRYALFRDFDGTEQRAVFIGLNPSTADEYTDDPTIRRCIGYAKSWGCAGLTMLNLFGLRATDPKELYRASDPVGEGNRVTIAELTAGSVVICAWGSHGRYLGQDQEILHLLKEVNADVSYLRLNKNGSPAHPLYLPKILRPIRWGNQ